jgi:hypothetical protein
MTAKADVTQEYKCMISAFSADLELATQGYNLNSIQRKIDNKDSTVLKDIELLSKLEFEIRHGRIKIVEVE